MFLWGELFWESWGFEIGPLPGGVFRLSQEAHAARFSRTGTESCTTNPQEIHIFLGGWGLEGLKERKLNGNTVLHLCRP